MEKKIMISVDDSMHAKFAVKYCAHLASKVDTLSIVLFNVQATISQYLIDESYQDLRLKSELNKVFQKNKAKSEKLLTDLKEEVVRIGIDENKITIKSQIKDAGIAKDVIKSGEAAHYDAIVLGRRGLSSLQEMFVGSVTSSIVQHCTYLPLWLVGSDVTPKNILAAVDGSENSLRAIDHLAFMLSGSKDINLTLFHVQPRLSDVCKVDFSADLSKDLESAVIKSNQQCLDNFYHLALKKFSQFDISSDHIRTKTKKGITGVKSAIVKEIKEGSYDTIVLGRRGLSKRFFTGSVSNYLLNKITDRVLWLVP